MDDAGRRALSQARRVVGNDVPRVAWRNASDPLADASAESLQDGPFPLPAARSLVRALTPARKPSLDAYAPLGPREPGEAGRLLVPVGLGDPGSPDTGAVLELLRTRAALLGAATPSGSAPRAATPHTVVVTAPGRRGDVVHSLTARERRAVLVTEAGPGDAGDLLAAALGLVDAVLVPDPARACASLLDAAAARGRALVGPELAGSTWEPLVDLGRAARCAWAMSRTSEGARPGAWRVERDGALVSRGDAAPRADVGREPRRVVVAGHDLKFADPLVDRLRADGHEVRIDQWTGHARHDVEKSRSLAAWADVVHCEWSLGNLAWYSRHLPKGVRLTSRLHLQEAATDFPRRVAHDALDSWVFVAPHVRSQVLRDTGFPARRAPWIPNAVRIPDAVDPAARAAENERRFVLGLVGVLPRRKGLHRALDVLADLRADDPRYRLRVRGHHPRDVAWMTARADEHGYYDRQLRRIAEDPRLTGAVNWDPHGPDMPAWYGSVGVALSTSDFESFHFTLPDGAAQGCVPRSLAWAGADALYPGSWLCPDEASLSASIRAATATPEAWRSAREDAHGFVACAYAEETVVTALTREVVGGRTT
nr:MULTISPECIES: hypothetical protein [unclassified Micrococcus]